MIASFTKSLFLPQLTCCSQQQEVSPVVGQWGSELCLEKEENTGQIAADTLFTEEEWNQRSKGVTVKVQEQGGK